MKLLDKLVLKDLLPMFGVGIAMFSTLWFAAGPLLEASKYLGQGVPLPIVLKLMGFSIPPVLALTFPMGMLLAVLVGFGRLSGDSEAVALYAGGVPFLRIAAPAAVMGLLASFCGYVINDRVASSASRQYQNLKTTALNQQGESTKPFSFEEREDGHLTAAVHIEKGFDIRSRMLRQVTILAYEKTGAPSAVFQAANAKWLGGKVWILQDVQVNQLGAAPSVAHFDRLSTVLLKKTPDNISFLQRDPNTLNFRELRQQIAELKASGMGDTEDVRNAEVGMWSKIALPFACLVFAVVGAPLGLQPQRTSRYTGWALSILIIFAYYVLYTAMSSVARNGGCAPALAVFTPNIVGLIAGAYLSWKASI